MSTSDTGFHSSRSHLPPQPTESRRPKHRACDNCKLRKVRCSGKLPCQLCQRSGASCQYNSPHGRLANAQRRLWQCQKRIALLEAAWHKYLPTTDLEVAIQGLNDLDPVDGGAARGVVEQGEPSPQGKSLNYMHESPTLHSSLDLGTILEPAEESDNCESDQIDDGNLDWDESTEQPSTNDGIGSLSANRRGIGYIGPQSGNALLKNLRYIHSHLFPALEPASVPLHSPSPSTVEDVFGSSYLDRCIDWYFKLYNCAYPILHEGYFRAQRIGVLPKPKDGSWPVLYNIVCAVGSFCGDMSSQSADHLLYQRAWQSLSPTLLQRGSLALVQALTLLANYLQKRNKPYSGLMLLGMAMNMAQSIGLHREFSSAAMSPFNQEIRRRLWWSIFVFDAGARMTFGWPTLTLVGVSTRLPRNLHDTDLVVDMDELPESRDTFTTTSSLIYQIRLAHICNPAKAQLLENKLPPAPVMLGIGDKVIEWLNSLPLYMQTSSKSLEYENMEAVRMVLVWRSMHLRIVIYRPYILDIIKRRRPLVLDSANEPSRRCADAARECTSSIVMFWHNANYRHRALIWYACYWLVTATFIHITCLLYEPNHEWCLAWREEIENARSTLEEMGVFEPIAAQATRIINAVMGRWPGSFAIPIH
ncbi:fungal-specific transcription factor domain-containing protein [Aspergillus bertholletiae]|uniref:Fungal-specific transcription factor domain-containing protein n=1 Tax=Aspergillus bertholletiae TaxID=1226010 RepID=A0A5N7BDG1_9EURO|nr:fungal-specific transcription factor domain-containing protein [Aspergillus bertholletiae]